MLQNLLVLMLELLGIIVILTATIRILKEYERGVIFRLGKLHGVKGPGLIFLIPLVDRMVKTDLRLVSIDVPRQEIITRDNVPVIVDAVVYFKILNPGDAMIEVANYYQSTFLIAQTSLRSVLGESTLDELLAQREIINKKLQEIIDGQTMPWGIKVPIVELKEVSLPADMKRAMAKQAEKERERRAKIIDAKGEYQAATDLLQAAKIIREDPIALQLRYLQTMREASVEKNSTFFFPFPTDVLIPGLTDKIKNPQKSNPEEQKAE